MCLVAIATMPVPAVTAAQVSDTKAAQTATEQWLSLIDAKSYPSSWDTAASFFRAAVNQERWVAMVGGARAPFGQLKSRALKSARATNALPGAPDGEYVVFTFGSSFEHKESAEETVTAMRDLDGTWRVAGYFIK
jgi:hypothetical protein